MTTSPEAAPLIALHQLSLYNTGRMPPEQLIAAFAARLQQFERVVGDIAAEKPKSRAQHHLIVGQRGMGKTMLLARIAAELRTDAALAAGFIPLVFAEEQYAVDRLSKFWLNCLDSLADARELVGDTTGVDEIDDTVRRLTAASVRAAKDDQPFAAEVYEAFAGIVKRSGQRPVLLVDNLQLVFERLDDGQQHSLRELLMRPGSPILIGAAPSLPSDDYAAAFYDQFKVHYLRPLDESEMRALLVHLADVAKRDDVRQRVLQHPARLTVLRQLTGGNPRTVLTLFFLYAEDFAPNVFGDLEGLLDRVTPLYKARFEELTPQQQVIASAVANHWDPLTAAKLATITSLPPGTISAQLDRLEKTGVIERTELYGQTSTGYQLAERFFNIWFLMRSASRRQRREVEFLTRFLENFYEPADRRRLARHLMRENHFSADRYVLSHAVADSLSDPEDAEELRRHAELTALREEAIEARARLRELIDFDSLPPATLAFDDLRKKLMSLVSKDFDVTPESFADTVLGDRAMFVNHDREKLAARGGKLTKSQIQTILKTIRQTRAADEKHYTVEAVTWVTQRLSTGQIRAADDAEDWNRAFRQASDKVCIELMIDSLPDDFGAALEDSTYVHISNMVKPNDRAAAWRWYNWGYDLHVKLARYADAEIAYRKAITRNPKDSGPWLRMGILFHDSLMRHSEAEEAYREAIARNARNSWAWTCLGDLLQFELGRISEAEAAYRDAISNDGRDFWPWASLGRLLEDQPERRHEAETAYKNAIRLQPDNSETWNSLGNLYCDHLDRLGDAAKAYRKALQLDSSNDCAQQNLLFLRRDFMGEGFDAQPLMDELRTFSEFEYLDTNHLHDALFAAYSSNWGLARDALLKALTLRSDGGFVSGNTDDWLRASAVLLHLNYGTELLAFLDERGDTARLRPWVEALRAHQIGDRRALQNIAPEIRTSAEVFYDGIENLLKRLPEKTRRRPVVKPKRTRTRRRRRGL